MPVSSRSSGIVIAGVMALAPLPAAASIADVFSPGPRLDLAVELEYRTRFLTSDGPFVNDGPADRIGRERLDDARARVARAYLYGLRHALSDEALDWFPLFRMVEQRYRQYASVEILADGRAAVPLSGAAANADPGYSLRFRLNALGDDFDLAPGFELIRGALRWRLAYRPLSERIEMTARRPLMDRVFLDLTTGESLDGRGPDIHLGITLTF